MRITTVYRVRSVRVAGNEVVVEVVCGHAGGRPGSVMTGIRNAIEFTMPTESAPRIGDEWILDFDRAATVAP